MEALLQQLPASSGIVQLKECWLRILLDAALAGETVDVVEVCEKLALEFVRHQPGSTLSVATFESSQLRNAFAYIAKRSDNKQGRKELERRGDKTPRAGDSQKKKNAHEPLDDAESIYIRNAGLVILAAYLPAFFRRLGIAGEKQVLDGPVALALQHYLVFGSQDCAEWDLVLNKILCGVPLEDSVETPPPLTLEQKQEAELLLNAVIANWPALKNTSPNGLRATFLQREGVLRPKNGDWQLLLTRTSFDVLMDRLPWTISMIRLPWMPWMLYTDWAES
jgi:hypothetical protein